MDQQDSDVRSSREDNVDPDNKTPIAALEEENSYDHEMCREKRSSDIAIIGMSGRFAGSANLEAFWSHLQTGESCIEEIQRAGWEISTNTAGPEHVNTSQAKWGGMLEDIDQFDPLFFSISPCELTQGRKRDLGHRRRYEFTPGSTRLTLSKSTLSLIWVRKRH
jgi:hypothetical protein